MNKRRKRHNWYVAILVLDIDVWAGDPGRRLEGESQTDLSFVASRRAQSPQETEEKTCVGHGGECLPSPSTRKEKPRVVLRFYF